MTSPKKHPRPNAKSLANLAPFKPGRSGNPGGFTKEWRQHRDLMREMATKMGPTVIKRLFAIVEDPQSSWKAVCTAGGVILQVAGVMNQHGAAVGSYGGAELILVHSVTPPPVLEPPKPVTSRLIEPDGNGKANGNGNGNGHSA